MQQATRVKFAASCGCAIDDMGISPENFVLSDRAECARWNAYAQTPGASDRSWIVKVSEGFHGKGMHV